MVALVRGVGSAGRRDLVGGVASGVLSVGGVSVGGVSVGGVASGVVSVGGVASGVLTVGGASAGGVRSGGVTVGGETVGGLIACLAGCTDREIVGWPQAPMASEGWPAVRLDRVCSVGSQLSKPRAAHLPARFGERHWCLGQCGAFRVQVSFACRPCAHRDPDTLFQRTSERSWHPAE